MSKYNHDDDNDDDDDGYDEISELHVFLASNSVTVGVSFSDQNDLSQATTSGHIIDPIKFQDAPSIPTVHSCIMASGDRLFDL